MRVDRHNLSAPEHRTHNICRLTANTWQGLQRIEVGGQLATKALDDTTREGREVLGLIVGIGYALDIFVYLLGRSLGHSLGRRVTLEELGSCHIDALVGALRRENDSYEQLEGVAEVKFALGRRHMLREVLHNATVSLFGCHICIKVYRPGFCHIRHAIFLAKST